MTYYNEKKTLLEIKDLYLNFNVYQGVVQVLDGVNLTLEKGEILGIVGETGCGKTVTSRSIVRLLDSNAVIENGEIMFQDYENLLNLPIKDLELVRGKEISIIFQEPMTSLNPTMKVGDQVGEGLLLHFKEDMIKKGISILSDRGSFLSNLHITLLEKELIEPNSLIMKIASRIPIIKSYKKYLKLAAFQESIEILRSVGMPSPENTANGYPYELSGGMRQRVLIAIALACKPTLLIADEPTTAVDVTTQAKILKLILNFKETRGTSILVITHNLGVIAEICSKVCVMYAGQIVEIGKVNDIYSNPLHPYTTGLIRAIHEIGDTKELEEIEGVVPILLNPPEGCRFHPRCPYVMNICRKEKPNSLIKEPEHSVYCWKYINKEG